MHSDFDSEQGGIHFGCVFRILRATYSLVHPPPPSYSFGHSVNSSLPSSPVVSSVGTGRYPFGTTLPVQPFSLVVTEMGVDVIFRK